MFADSWTIGTSLGSAIKEVCPSLNLAAEKVHVQFVQYLLNNGASVNLADKEDEIPLCVHVQTGRELLNNGASVNFQMKEVTHFSTEQLQMAT